MSFGPNPWQQRHWDWRAAANFMCGGAGGGLIVFAVLAGAANAALLAGAALVGLGLSAVWLEIGRPWRALNVLVHQRRSWMSRESVAAALLLAAVAATLAGVPSAAWLAAPAALAFVYCQGRILRAARGIPAWREPAVVPLVVATGLAEGAGLLALMSAASGSLASLLELAWVAALAARLVLWGTWRSRLKAAPGALLEIDRAGRVFKTATVLALAAVLLGAIPPLDTSLGAVLQAIAGVAALAGGQWFKFNLVTRAGFNQGFSLPHLPVRGARRTQEP